MLTNIVFIIKLYHVSTTVFTYNFIIYPVDKIFVYSIIEIIKYINLNLLYYIKAKIKTNIKTYPICMYVIIKLII